MSADEVLGQVGGILAEVLGADEADIRPEATLLGDLQATSLDIVDLLFQLKRKFSIELTLQQVQQELSGSTENGGTGGLDDSLFEHVTVQDVTNWVSNRLPS